MALLALAEAFGSRGFAGRDEIMVLEDMARRSYGGVTWPPLWGNGFWLKQAQFQGWNWLGWKALHLPVLLAQAAQAWALGNIAQRLGGPRVAQGAVLASLLSATALLYSRSLLPFAILPAILCVSLALLLRGGAWAWAAGALLCAGFFEYEGCALALPGFAALLFWEPRVAVRSRIPFIIGAAVSLVAVLWLCRASLAEWWQFRQIYSAPLHHWQEGQVGQQLWNWLRGGHPEAYLGVDSHPTAALWALPFVALGLATQWKRRPWLPLAIVAALLALLPSSGVFEPQRSAAALPALALCAGFGWRWAWQRAQQRAWLAWALLLLPLLGLAIEQRAFERSMEKGEERYGRSVGWMAAAKDARFPGHVDAALMASGLAMEAVLGPLQGPPHWVWMPGDLGEDAPTWPGVALYDNSRHLTGDGFAQVPTGQPPLLDDLAILRKFWITLPRDRPHSAQACRAALQNGGLKTKLARAALSLRLLQDSVPMNSYSLEDLQRLRQEAFKSPRFYRAASAMAQEKDLRLNYWLLYLLRQHAGEARLTDGERQFLQAPWDLIPSHPQAPPWPAPSAS